MDADPDVGTALLSAAAGVILRYWDESRRIVRERGDEAFDQVAVLGKPMAVALVVGRAPSGVSATGDMTVSIVARTRVLSRAPAGSNLAAALAAPAAEGEVLLIVVLRGRCYPLRLARADMETLAAEPDEHLSVEVVAATVVLPTGTPGGDA